MFRWLIALCVACVPLFAQDDLRRGFDQLAQAHPGHLKVETLGASFVASIRDQTVKGDLPAILLVGSLHGHERAPGEACLQITRDLLEDKAFRDQLSKCEVIVIPLPNAGGRSAGVNGVTLPFDDDRDGKTDEDGPNDLNGDGVITQMRVRGTRYIATASGILVEAAPGQAGQWDLLWEGGDDDGDGRVNEDAVGTITLANDWSIRWDDKQPGANRFMMQLAETRALADYVSARPSIFAAFQLRSIGGAPAFAQGPKVQGKDPYERDKQMSATLAKLWGDDKAASSAEGAGNLLDWLYESRGAHAASLHLASVPPLKEEEGAAKPTEEEARQLAWKAYVPGDYIEWKAFKHPQLGDVEIGGWKTTARNNPTEADAQAGATRVAEFLKQVVKAAPRIEVSKVEVEDKTGGLYRVRLTLKNAGALDYRTAFSDDKRIHLPVFVSLKEVKEVELISGTRRLKQENLLADGTATFEWLVRAGKETALQFEIESDRCGKISHSVATKDCPNIVTEEE
jgi:hypothetical protein